jgi:nitrite reductase/ring-hydroxylating ferredoxin subunit
VSDGPVETAGKAKEYGVCRVEELPEGTHRIVPIGKFGVGVYNVRGSFYAITNYCPHEGGPLCRGLQSGRTILDEDVPGRQRLVAEDGWLYCPWHQWGFSLATGTTAVKPEWSVRTYEVKVVDGMVIVVR